MLDFGTFLRQGLRCEKTHYLLGLVGLFFLVFMHYHDAHRGGYGLALPYNVLSWIPLSWMIGLGLYQIVSQRLWRYSGLTLGLIFCCFLLVIPGFYPDSLPNSSNPLLYGLFAGLLLFIALQQFRWDSTSVYQLLFIILLGVWLAALIGWLQYFNLDSSLSGFVAPADSRPFGNFGQPNVQASFLVTGLIISGFLLGRHAVFKPGASSPRLTKTLKLALLLSPLLLMPMIVLLGSRTGWLAALVSLLLIQAWLWSCAGRRNATCWLGMSLAGLVLGLVLGSTPGGGSPADRLNFDGARSTIYPQTIAMFMERPWSGYGYGSFEGAYMRYTADKYAAGEFEQPGHPNLAHPHNELILWGVEGGVLALLALLIAAAMVLLALFRMKDRPLALGLLALLFPITLHSQTEMPFFASVPHWLSFIVLIFLVDFFHKEVREKIWKESVIRERKVKYIMAPAFGAVAVPLLVTLFMLTTLQSGKVLNRFESNPAVDVSSLLTISNPIAWQDRLAWDLNFGQMVLGIFEDRPELLLPFIEWAPGLIERQPRGIYYQYLVIAYRAIGDLDMAERTRQEAEYMLPYYDFNYSVSGIAELENWNPQEAQVLIMQD